MKRFIGLVASLGFALGAVAATPEEDVEHYIKLFQDPLAEVDRAGDELAWKGISDPRLYDLIEARLLRDAPQASPDSKLERNRVNHSIKALGYSGQMKYQATLSGFVHQRPYGAYARRAIDNLGRYARWNPLIADRASWDAQYPDDVNRVRNMLRSGDLELQTVGAKRIFFAHWNEPVLLDLAAERLRESYKTAASRDAVEAAGWMLNALGKANAEKYRPLLEEVAAGAASDKVRARADKALRR